MSFSRLAAVAITCLVMAGSALPQSAVAQAPAAPAPATPADPFGQEVTLTPKTMVLAKGAANWDTAFDTLVSTFKAVLAALDKQGIKPSGPPMTIYTASDDTGFEFMAGFPVTDEPKQPLPAEMSVGKSPEGRALKFVHRGSYDSMDTTYEAITNHLEGKGLEAKDLFVEQYVTDPVTTPEERLVIEVYVPVK